MIGRTINQLVRWRAILRLIGHSLPEPEFKIFLNLSNRISAKTRIEETCLAPRMNPYGACGPDVTQ